MSSFVACKAPVFYETQRLFFGSEPKAKGDINSLVPFVSVHDGKMALAYESEACHLIDGVSQVISDGMLIA